MFFITYAAAVLSVILVVCAAAFMLLERRTELTRTLTLYAAAAALWTGGNAAADVSYTTPSLILAHGLAFIGGALSILLFLVLVDLLIDERMPSRRRFLTYAIPTVGMSLFSFSELAIVDTYFPVNIPAQVLPGPLYIVSLIILMVSLVYGLVRLSIGLARETREVRRIQLSYVLLGLILMLFGGLIFDIALPLMGELRFYTLGPLASLFFILSTGYAITSHRLIDIRIGIQRGMMYTFLLTLITAAYASVLWLVPILSPLTSEAALSTSIAITIMAGIFGVPLIEKYFRRCTDSIFFKQACDYAEAVRTLSEISYQHVELPEFVQASETELMRIFRTASVQVEYEENGIDTPDFSAIESGRILAVPIRLNGSYIASIYAGPKRSGDVYTVQDQQLLETFAYQTATAFMRAELYEKTRRHAQELERTVAERTYQAQKVRESERQTLIDLSHNLQTPLAVFQIRLEQLKHSRLAASDARSLEQSVRRLSSFIYDVLALAKLESEVPDAHTEIDLSELTEGITEEVTVIAASKGVRIENRIESHITIRGDEKRIREAILNIASNAMRYMREEGDRRISFTLLQSGRTAQLTISDTGYGISTIDLPHVFDRFYRGRNDSHESRGSGLGLSIVKRIVEKHGGTVVIRSTQGNGATVRIQLPLANLPQNEPDLRPVRVRTLHRTA